MSGTQTYCPKHMQGKSTGCHLKRLHERERQSIKIKEHLITLVLFI
jgi:hypothetical protein